MTAKETKSTESKIIDRLDKIDSRLEQIEFDLHGTKNPHGGLIQKVAVLEIKIDGLEKNLNEKIDGVEKTMNVKINGLKETLNEKIDGIGDKFDKMLSFSKWAFGIVVTMVGVVAVPIFLAVVLPMIRKWAGIVIVFSGMTLTAKAQLMIDVYPSQDNPTTQTLWVFSGSSTANYGSSIRSSGNFHRRDSWKLRRNVNNTAIFTHPTSRRIRF